MKNTIRKIKDKIIGAMVLAMTFIYTNPALAAVTEVNAESFNTKIIVNYRKVPPTIGRHNNSNCHNYWWSKTVNKCLFS